MEIELWISAVALVSILLGGTLRVVKGWVDAKKDGEEFSKYKFYSTLITTFVESLVAFAGVSFSDIVIGPSGALVFFIGCFILGYLGAKEFNQIATGAIKKLGGKK